MDLETFRVVVYISVPFVLATFWAVLDASQKEFGSLAHKAAWMLVGAIPFFGFIIYLIFGFKKGKKPDHS
ncbi:MAG: PLDc N-terminal domain-containing protein [Pseudomonadota bacterium]